MEKADGREVTRSCSSTASLMSMVELSTTSLFGPVAAHLGSGQAPPDVFAGRQHGEHDVRLRDGLGHRGHGHPGAAAGRGPARGHRIPHLSPPGPGWRPWAAHVPQTDPCNCRHGGVLRISQPTWARMLGHPIIAWAFRPSNHQICAYAVQACTTQARHPDGEVDACHVQTTCCYCSRWRDPAHSRRPQSGWVWNHSTVSRRIRALEKEFRQRLVISSAQGCEITEFGRSLLEPAERIDRAVAAVTTTSGQDSARPATYTGLVRVLAPEAFGSQFVAPVLAGMARDHPGVHLELVTATRPVVQGVGVDIEIGVGEPVSRRVHTIPLADYTLGLYASRQYLDQHDEPGKPANMRHHALVYYIDGLLRVSDLDFIETLIPGSAIRIGSTSVHAQLAATRAGGGIGILPDFLASAYPDLAPVLADRVMVLLHFTAASPRRTCCGGPRLTKSSTGSWPKSDFAGGSWSPADEQRQVHSTSRVRRGTGHPAEADDYLTGEVVRLGQEQQVDPHRLRPKISLPVGAGSPGPRRPSGHRQAESVRRRCRCRCRCTWVGHLRHMSRLDEPGLHPEKAETPVSSPTISSAWMLSVPS